jgi:purine-nucleoside phosphorylase
MELIYGRDVFMNQVYNKLLQCYESVKQKTDFKPDVAIVLGSGLGDFANDIKVVYELNYSDIEGFPVSTVAGHEGKFIFGFVNDVAVVCMKGRIHYYEGYQMSNVILPIRLMKLFGAKILFLTNACGGINPNFKAGDFMMIKDHISCFVPNPLVGPNLDELGPRFPDMTHIYDHQLQDIIKKVSIKLSIDIREGVYLQYSGPSYESPAEIRMFNKLGADAVGMSTAVEAITANHCGLKVCGISCISNLAAGMTNNRLTHEEVQAAAMVAAPKFKTLVTQIISDFKEILNTI